MAYKPRTIDLKLRERHEQRYQAAPSISVCFPALEFISLEVRFTGADRHSPYKQIYTKGMQAYFFLQCPSRECVSGGFDLNSSILEAARQNAGAVNGEARCSGVLSSGPSRGAACPVTLKFDIDCVSHRPTPIRRR